MDILPYDENLENCVLGTVILHNEAYDTVSKYFVNRNVFYQKRASLLWDRLTKMKKKKEVIDTFSVASTLSKKEIERGLTAHYVTICTEVGTVKGSLDFHANKLYEKYLLRQIVVEADKVKDEALSNNDDIYNVIVNAHSLFGELKSLQPSKTQDIEDMIEDTLDSIKNKASKLIKTGYPNIDKYSGGLTRGEITIIGGRPGHGKTTVMVNLLAKAIEQGHKAMFFSRELPNSELLKKILCLESGKMSYGMIRQNVFTDHDLKNMEEAIQIVRNKYSKDKFLMFDNIKDFALASSEIKKFKPDIIFDDYIQLIDCKCYKDRRLQI